VFETGFLTIARWRGVPIRVHWTAPLGAFIFGHFRFLPGFWLGFLLIVIVHELGHAFLVQRRRLHVEDVQVHGLGGVCRFAGGSAYDHAIIAWGGVLAQALVLLLPAVLLHFLVPIRNAFLAQFVWALTEINLLLIAINLLPIPMLDGGTAWKLPRMWWRRRKQDRRSKAASAKKRKSKPASNGESTEDPAEAARRLAQHALDSARKKH